MNFIILFIITVVIIANLKGIEFHYLDKNEDYPEEEKNLIVSDPLTHLPTEREVK